jgi:hypothetical protein
MTADRFLRLWSRAGREEQIGVKLAGHHNRENSMGIRSARCSFQTAIKTNHTAATRRSPGIYRAGASAAVQR